MPLRVALYIAAIVAALVIGPRGPLYWDSFGYVSQALRGRMGGLGLGRPVFVLVSHAVVQLALAAGVSVWRLEPLLRTFWLAFSAAAAPITYAIVRTLGPSRRAAMIAGVALALSPAWGHAANAVLTDGPSLTLSLLAVLAALRAVQLDSGSTRGVAWRAGLAGVALGIAVGMREQSVWYGITLAWLATFAPPGKRITVAWVMLLGFALSLAMPIAYAISMQPGYVRGVVAWLHAMQRERAAHPTRIADLAAWVGWLVALGPATLVAALVAWTRRTRDLTSQTSPIVAVVVPAAMQLVLLAWYPDIAYSPRYLLPALPGALAIPAAIAVDAWLDDRRIAAVVLALLVVPIALAAPLLRAREASLRRTIDTLPTALLALPPDSTVVTGQPCPAIQLDETLLRVDAHGAPSPHWNTICPGWSWPMDLDRALNEVRASGAAVTVDLRASSWPGNGQQDSLREVERWWREHRDDPRVTVWR